MNTYYATYKYFDSKGRRLAAFCRYLNATEAEIVVIPCSKHDQFSKPFARNLYTSYLDGKELTAQMEVNIVKIKPEYGELKTLLEYCNNKYNLYYKAKITVNVLKDASGNISPIKKSLFR